MRKVIPLLGGIFLIIAGILAPLLTGMVVLILPETFASTALIEPAVGDPSAFATEMSKIQSEAVLGAVATNLSLPRKWAQMFKEEGELSLGRTVDLLRQKIQVRQSRVPLTEITVFSEDRLEAATIANEIAKVYRASMAATDGPQSNSVGQLIDKAEPGLRPVRPNKPRAIAIAMCVGLILAILGFLLIATSKENTPVRDR